jgi:hypothetical protein
MKKIIALALALIMVLSMGVVALAATDPTDPTDPEFGGEYTDADTTPGAEIVLTNVEKKGDYTVKYDFTSASEGYKGISLIESIDWVKTEDRTYDLVITFKENLTSITTKEYKGLITVTEKATKEVVEEIEVEGVLGNTVVYIDGAKKAADAVELTDEEMAKDTVMYAEDGAGFVTFTDGVSLTGLVKVEDGEKAQVYFADGIDEDTMDAIEAYLGEDYEAIVEYYNFGGSGFKSDVAFTYEAYAEDPHFFYAWDGEKFVDLEGKYNDDEDVDAYEFTAAAKGIIIVTDVEIVAAAADTKNPDTGANDVVGVAAALAVVSLVAAGAVSLKK